MGELSGEEGQQICGSRREWAGSKHNNCLAYVPHNTKILVLSVISILHATNKIMSYSQRLIINSLLQNIPNFFLYH